MTSWFGSSTKTTTQDKGATATATTKDASKDPAATTKTATETKTATQTGKAGKAPADPDVAYWYPAENNWQECRKKMDASLRRVRLDFTGEVKEEESEVAQTSWFSKGKTRTESRKVADIYVDHYFRPETTSWVAGGSVDEISDITSLPALWPRLCEYTTAPPYPMQEFGPGMGISCGRVYQGALSDFYLVQAMHAIGQKVSLVQSIFGKGEYCEPKLGCFILRFYKHAQWQHIEIDDHLPCDKDENPLCCTSEMYPNLSWPCLIEKAYAKLHGSWEGLSEGGHVEEAMTDLTGGLSGRFHTSDVAGDRMWQYFWELQRTCVFACNINAWECAKRNIPLEAHWAAAIAQVAKIDGIPFICVSLTAPLSTLRHLPKADMSEHGGYGESDGYVWLRIEDFHQLFDTIYECRLVNSELGGPQEGIYHSPGWVPNTSYYETLWAFQGTVVSETAPSFLLQIDQVPCEVYLDISQTDMRYFQAGRQPQAPLLLRFFQCSTGVDEAHGGEIYMVHMSAWGHSRDAVCSVKVFRPGKYMAMVSMPHKYRCKRMIFRSYSTEKLTAVKVITAHRDFINVMPDGPLGAVPYSLTGFMRPGGRQERLPSMFDEEEGLGRPLAGNSKGIFGLTKSSARQNDGGVKVVGQFGGRDAHASVEAQEQYSNCSTM